MAETAGACHFRAMRRILPLLVLAQCSASSQFFAGMLQPASGTCDAPSRATLSVRHDAVQFAPSSGVLVLSGTVRPDGSITATLVRPGVDKRPYTLALRAALRGRSVDGDYVTQRCRYAVHLQSAD